MRYAAEQKARTRGRILDAAARLFRERGFAGTSVQDVMAAAGLTVGGFYAHFTSKQALFEEATHHALVDRLPLYARLDEQIFAGAGGDAEAARGAETGSDSAPDPGPTARERARAWLSRALRTYLSEIHRNAPADGCPLVALVSDYARSERPLREAFEQDLRATFDFFEARLHGADELPARKRAVATVALAVGGVALARAVADETLAREILDASYALGARTVDPEPQADPEPDPELDHGSIPDPSPAGDDHGPPIT